MSCFFILDFYSPPNDGFLLINLLSNNIYFIDLYMYPIIDNDIYSFKNILLYFSNLYFSLVTFDFQTLKFIFIYDKFFHKYHSIIILYIYFIFLIYTLSIKYKFYIYWIKFCNDFVNFIKFYSNELYILSGHFTKLLLWNLWYFISFWVRKKTWNKLNFRALELKKKEKNKRHIHLQHIKFFYTKFMFDVFFAILIRFLYFWFLYLFRLIIFIILKIMNFFIFKWYFNILYIYIYVYIISLMKKLISINFFNRVFVVINYFKIEFFIYIFNDRGFLGGFIYYIFTTIYNKMGIFNNNNNWENIEFKTSNIMYNIYYKISPVFINYDYYKIFNNMYYFSLNIFIFILMPLLFFLIKIISLILYLVKNVNLLYELTLYKFNSYNKFTFYYLLFVISILYFNNNIIFILILYWLFYIFIINISFINDLSKYIINDNIFIFFGYLSIFTIDVIKYLIIFIFRSLIFIFIKLKYLIIFFILYKLGFIYIIYLGFTTLTFGYIDYWLFYFIDLLLYIILDAYNVFKVNMLPSDFNGNLILVVKNDFSNAFENIHSYIENSFLIRLYTLNFRGIDFSKFKWETFNQTRKSAIKILTLRRFYYNLFLEFLSECYVFSIICKNYLIFKLFKFYYIYIFKYSNLNLYYYLFKKLYTLIYLFYIYLRFYLRFLYSYIVPCYIIPKFIYFKIFSMYTYFNYYIIRIIYVASLIYYYLNLFSIFIIKFSFFNITRSFLIVSLIWAYLYNMILFIYCIINDLCYLLINKIVFLEYHGNFAEFYLYYFINKSLFIDNSKDLIMNYFRLYKSNLINFNILESVILGGKLRSVSMYDLDNMNMDQVREYGVLTQRIDDYLIQSKPEVKHNRYFKNRDNLLIYSDIYLLLFSYYNIDLWESLYMNEYWIFNFFVRRLILYYLMDFYLLYYLILYFLFYYFFENKKEREKENLNIDYMWNKLKDGFSYKLLNNNRLFIRALDYYKVSSGKKKITSKLFSILSKNWKIVHKNFRANILKKYNKIKNLNIKKLKKISLGKYSSFISTNKLRSVVIERNLYYNNKILFYWKNYLFFDKDKSFYIKYNRKNEFLYFFLSLIFRNNVYSSSIFYYFDTFNKMYFFYNQGFLEYLNKTYDIIIKYYEKIDSNIFNNKGSNWLLNKDVSLILYKDEYDHQSDMFSLNFNIIIPNYEKIFFWIILILYIYFTKFHWRLSPQVDFIGRVNKFIFIKSLLINDNFLYLYDLALYWVNNYFMFDIKHFSYEYNDYVNEWMKNKIYFKHIRPSPLFIVNNDPLFIYKKSNSYHMLFLNKNYYYFYSSYCLYMYVVFKKLFLIILLYLLYNKVIINTKRFNVYITDNIHINLILNLSYLYIINIINISNYINFVYRKILFK